MQPAARGGYTGGNPYPTLPETHEYPVPSCDLSMSSMAGSSSHLPLYPEPSAPPAPSSPSYIPHAPPPANHQHSDAYYLALAENDILLRLLEAALVDKKKGGIESKVHFVEDSPPAQRGVDGDTNEWLLTRYRDTRDHLKFQRFCMTDIVDTWQEHLMDAIHSNKVTNKIESTVKTKGYHIAGKIGSKVSKVASYMPSTIQERCKISEQRYATIEVAEVKLDWPTCFPPVPLGLELRRRYYHLLPDIYLDGASGGVMSEPVRVTVGKWDMANQANPVLWRFKITPVRVRQAEQSVARLIGIDPNDLKFCLNPEQGVCSVLLSLPWEPGQRVIYVDDLSHGIRNAVFALTRRYGVEVVEVVPQLPATGEQIRQQIKGVVDRLPKGQTVLVVSPDVGHRTGVKYPCRKLAATLHKRGINLLLEGSMAIGHKELNISAKGAEWYVASLTSWAFCAPGTSFIVAHPLKQPVTSTLTVSYFDRGPAGTPAFNKSFEKEFSYCGLMDFSGWCACHQSLLYAERTCGGWGNIQKYIDGLGKHVVSEVSKIWNTRPVQAEDFGGMPVFPIPDGANLPNPHMTAALLTYHLANMGMVVYFVVLPVMGVPTICVRFSCQVYNHIREYIDAATAISRLRPYTQLQYPDAQEIYEQYTTLSC